MTPREQFLWWMQKQRARNEREWAGWDGSVVDAERINDQQCERIDEAKRRYGWPMGLACTCAGDTCQCAGA